MLYLHLILQDIVMWKKNHVNRKGVFICIEKGHFDCKVILECYMPTAANALVSIQWNHSNKNGI